MTKTKFYCKALSLVLSIGITVCSAEEVDISTLTYEKDILPLVEVYCMDCHDSITTEGELDIERFETTDMVIESIGIWDRMALRIKNKEMPPNKEDVQPTDEERELLSKWIEKLEIDNSNCDNIASEQSVSWYPGYVMSRRLNRAEYENTLSDLLGIDLNVTQMFPADGSGGEGFDNNGSALFLSAIQVEKYLEAADIAVEAAVPALSETDHQGQMSILRGRVVIAERRGRNQKYSSLIPHKPQQRDRAYAVARDAVQDFATRAWRRPLEAEEVDRLMTMFDRVFDRGDGIREGLKLAYKAVLISPNFLFLAEPEPEKIGDYPLGDYQLASRLSYFLWASMPDEELLTLAREGKLQHDEVLRAQVKRMLQDPKAIGLGERFAAQWLGITQLGEITKPDANRFPQYTDALAEAMRQEAILLFTRIVQEDRSLLELIDSDYTYMNESLAKIYGIEGVKGDDLRLVSFDDPNRGGMLGTAAVLTMTSHPLRTSPVLRGKWVLESLLGDRVPPPPPNVPALPEEGEKHPQGLTFRQQLEVHRENPECASCHDRMDPIGFGLENFDPIGRWRVTQAEQPVDASGTLPNGESFNGPQELKAIIFNRKDDFAKNLSRKMVGYGLGRSLTRFDDCIVNDGLAALKENEYKPSALITEVVLSYPFRHRYSNGQTD